MKLRKKLIILSILFLFGFGVFFGTFAMGGYLVKADAPGDYLYYIEYDDLEIDDGDYYNVEIEFSINEQGEYYIFNILFYNFVYDFNFEDYNISYSGLAFGAQGNDVVNDTGYDEQDITYSLIDVYQFTDDDFIGLQFEIAIYLDDFASVSLINPHINISGIYLDNNNGVFGRSNEIIFSQGYFLISHNFINYYYDEGYTLGLDDGYDDGYAEGHEDGYDEGYALGETAGYNDGLDIGYYNGYEVGHYDGYTEGEAFGYSKGLDEGYDIGLDEGIQLSGYKEAYEKGIAKAENTASTWFKGLFDGFQRFFNIQLGGVSIGAIILIPLSITFAWFIIRQFRGGGGGD